MPMNYVSNAVACNSNSIKSALNFGMSVCRLFIDVCLLNKFILYLLLLSFFVIKFKSFAAARFHFVRKYLNDKKFTIKLGDEEENIRSKNSVVQEN